LNECRLRVVIVLAFTEGKTMATYVYETIPKDPKKKPRQFEVQQKMSDPPLTKDPETGEPVRRVITGGSGWVTHGASILSMNTRKGRR
jgi:predicted nucleic acid-binding Zn ribbon protein